MFLIDKYDIKDPWDIDFNKDIYIRMLKLDSIYSWNNKNLNVDESFNDLPNLLFHGKDGSGKKSLVRLFLKRIFGKDLKSLKVKYQIKGYGSNNLEIDISQSLYHLEIYPNGTGLDKYLVQEVIKEYASKKILLMNKERSFKVIWIHNVQNLSYYAQTALRCTMEKYSSNCKFILSGNQLSKIIEPLRSRCLMVRIPSPTEDDIMRVLLKISLKESKLLNITCYDEIIKKCNNNIKDAIIYLEMKYYKIPIEVSWKNYLSEIVVIMNKALKKQLVGANIERIRFILYKIFITNIDGTTIIKELLNQLLSNFVSYNLTYEIVELCTKYENSLSKGKKTIIHLEAFIYSVMHLIHSKMKSKKKVIKEK
mgnify:CR=1 FL=1